MRIIGGHARSILLKAPPGDAVRPTTDRVKEALFGTLEPLVGTVVVDLFAGSGALGLEALSRGAATVVMVESQPRHCRVIEANLANVRKAMHTPGQVRILTANALTVPRLLAELRPDFVLADPPYQPEPGQQGAADLLRSVEFQAWCGGALVVIEQSRRALPEIPITPAWTLLRQRGYGDTVLCFLRAGAAAPPSAAASAAGREAQPGNEGKNEHE